MGVADTPATASDVASAGGTSVTTVATTLVTGVICRTSADALGAGVVISAAEAELHTRTNPANEQHTPIAMSHEKEFLCGIPKLSDGRRLRHIRETPSAEMGVHAMQTSLEPDTCRGLPPLVGVQLVVVSFGLERSYDRARGLELLGYRVAACGEPQSAGDCIEAAAPEAIVVDLGRDLCFPADIVARIRERSNAPVLVVGCAGTYAEMLGCFEAGADDYARSKCQTEEIDLRLRALFRRASARTGSQHRSAVRSVLHVGDIEIDQASQVVRKRGHVVALSPTEFRLLVTLAERPGEVIPSKALIARVWGNQYAGETHYLRLYVRYLRQKLEDDPSHPIYIVNRWGSGYALEASARAVA